ncbi:MAG: zinc transporter ZupT [Synechococcaceae cyanobacterium]|nr:zinc transporter ZupT [Synechococcaceae cyanobacterium]
MPVPDSQVLESRVVFAFLLTLAAGLSTGLGSLLGLFNRGFNPRVLSIALSFSAGVMLYVSFVEIFPKARAVLAAPLGDQVGHALAVLALFAGMGAIALIDHLLPHPETPLPSAVHACDQQARAKLMRTGLFSALAIAIHNFPEGLLTFLGALSSPRLGIGIAIAIAIHNIPEGLAVSAPIHYATGSRRQAFWISLASGMAEPLGALVGYQFLRAVLTDTLLGLVFASVAGVMIYICFDELLPTAQRLASHPHLMIGGVVAGMAVMSISLVLLG